MKTPRLFFTLLITAVSIAAPLLHADEPTKVRQRTADGVLEGELSADGQVRSFKGVPYAAPPVGELRWKEPQPVTPWKGVRSATQFGPRAMQAHIWDDMFFFDEGPSEDCLYLNIWIPEQTTVEKLPVMFWIHGGGFVAGGASEPRQDGAQLCQKDVIVVSVGYRMGVFGFMAHPELTEESPHDASGNYGLLDMVAALEWVRDNISEFGGDPQNVTIFGESAGSMAVSALMSSPLSKGLFHKAIGQSGAMFSPWRETSSLAEAEATAITFADEAFGFHSLEDLRALDAEELLAAAWKPEARWSFRPNIDGHFLPEPPAAIFAKGEQAQVPLMAGWNLDEGGAEGFLQGQKPTLDNYRKRAKAEFGELADSFLAAYSASGDDEVERSAADYAGDRFIGYGTWKWIQAHAANSDEPVYRYRFDQLLPLPEGAPSGAKPRAAHSWDIEYVFRVLDSKELPWRDEDRKVSEQMSTYWTNFAKEGDPNGSSVPRWPDYDSEPSRPVLHIDATPSVEPDTHRTRYEFLDTLAAEE